MSHDKKGVQKKYLSTEEESSPLQYPLLNPPCRYFKQVQVTLEQLVALFFFFLLAFRGKKDIKKAIGYSDWHAQSEP